MPIDILAVRRDAIELSRTARVSPVRFTLFYLCIDFLLQLLDTVLPYLLHTPASDLLIDFSFYGILITLVSNVLSAGLICYGLCVCRGGEAGYDYLFDGFSFAGKAILLTVLQSVMIGVGSMFFLFPGFLLAYTYQLAMFNLCDDPSLNVFAALRRSREQMNGHKMELFRLQLTFWPQLLIFLAAILGCTLLSSLFPEDLSGDLLFLLVTSVATGAAMLLFYPRLILATTKFYFLVSEAPSVPQEDNDELPPAEQ